VENISSPNQASFLLFKRAIRGKIKKKDAEK